MGSCHFYSLICYKHFLNTEPELKSNRLAEPILNIVVFFLSSSVKISKNHSILFRSNPKT